jgi:hypothetical protein
MLAMRFNLMLAVAGRVAQMPAEAKSMATEHTATARRTRQARRLACPVSRARWTRPFGAPL